MSKQTSTDTLMKLGLAGVLVGLVAIAWVSAVLGEFLTPTGMPWTNFTDLVARVKAGTFAWPGAATWIAIVLAVGFLFGAALLAAGRGGKGSAAQRELGSRLATGADRKSVV